MKELLEDIKLSKVSYLIEILEKGNNKNKFKALKKLEKYKITKKIGLFLIENSTRNFNIENEFGGVSASLIELCFKDYQEEYTDAIRNVFEQLDDTAKNHVLYLLTNIDSVDTFKLYVELVLKYYNKKDNIPIGELHNKPLSYPYIFPELYKTLKFNISKNNVLIIINNYLNAGVIPKEDIKKNKKLLTDAICRIFDEALKFKFKTTFKGLNNKKYKQLRYYLEIAINIELYISGRKTKDYLKKLYKTNDNQIKLFILDNYSRSNTDISKLDLSEIAKDKASRYALFELLSIYNKLDLMPKYYLDQNFIAESDFYTNFVITTNYETEPKKLKFLKKVNINSFDYYAFTFNFDYKYNSANSDYLTNYICNQLGIQKYNGEKITDKFIGISGGYNPNITLSSVVKNPKKLLIGKIEDNSNIDELIDKIILSNEVKVETDNKITIVKKNKKDKTNKLMLKAQKKEEKLQKKALKAELKKQKQEQKLIQQEQEKLIKNEDNIINENLPDQKKIDKLEKQKEKLEQKILKQEQEKLIKNEDNIINENLPNDKKSQKKKKKLLKLEKKRQRKEEKLRLKQEKKLKKLNQELQQSIDGELVEVSIKRKKRHIFAYFALFLFTVYIGLLIYCILYIYGVGSINDGMDEEIYLPAKLEDKGKFIEIGGHDIFNQMEGEYFVLLFTGSTKKQNKYFRFINEYAKRDFKFYYVNLKNEENKFLYSPNDLNFTLYGDRLLKVKDHEYEYYVDEKKNILREMDTQITEIKEKENEEAKLQKEKEKEEARLAKEEAKKETEEKEQKETAKTDKKESKKKMTKKEKKEIQKIELKRITLN